MNNWQESGRTQISLGRDEETNEKKNANEIVALFVISQEPEKTPNARYPAGGSSGEGLWRGKAR